MVVIAGCQRRLSVVAALAGCSRHARLCVEIIRVFSDEDQARLFAGILRGPSQKNKHHAMARLGRGLIETKHSC